MHSIDPYEPGGVRYECQECGYRTEHTDRGGPICPECDEEMRDLSLPRE
jgi:rubrerythrin